MYFLRKRRELKSEKDVVNLNCKPFLNNTAELHSSGINYVTVNS
jgi:hypothetical protein